MKQRSIAALLSSVLILGLFGDSVAQADDESAPAVPGSTNSIGMKLVDIPAGTFLQGTDGPPRDDQPHLDGRGFLNEEPQHEVTISSDFRMSATPITNAQYEKFDPSHAELRGKLGWSTGDDEAAIFVSWNDAVAFTEWLSEEEGVTYRLPTEAEWEYAARAGTTTDYWTGDELPQEHWRNQRQSWFPGRPTGHEYVSLQVGTTPANPWGLHDVHGLVEEWVHDWYGPYEEGAQVDPVGRADGEFKVTRGGSHSTQMATEGGWPTYLRSAARAATVPEIANWVTGFRVVQADMPASEPLPVAAAEPMFQNVDQTAHAGQSPDADDVPYFRGPRSFMKVTPEARGPFYKHNHQPAVTEMPNGDLMAIWYTTQGEEDRVLAQAGARLRHGADEWDEPSIFWDAPGRNEHGNELWWDGKDTVYHWSGLSAVGTYDALALVQRKSTDNGVTWSKPELIQGEQGLRNQVISAATRLSSGRMILPADATPSSGTAIHVSDDNGLTWRDPGTADLGLPPITGEMHAENAPDFVEGGTGSTIAGFHASVAELSDGRLLALGRGDVMGEAPDLPATRSPGQPGFGSALGLGTPEPNAFVEMPKGIMSGVEDFTISTWVNRSSTSNQNWTRIFDFGTGKKNTMFLAIEGGGTGPRFTIDTESTDGQQVVTSPTPLGQGWNHVAVTKSGSTLTIYVNGEAVGSGDHVTASPADLGDSDRNWIGRSIYGDPTLNATVDEFQIYDYALKPAQIGDLLTSPEGSTGGGNVLRYSFDEEAGSQVTDGSGNAAHGLVDTTFNFAGYMPQSISDDEGETWTYSASTFDPLVGGQRAFLLNLQEENALMFATFTPRMEFTDSEGGKFTGTGLYTAVSLDDGKTWPHRRLVTDDDGVRILEEGGGRGEFVLSPFSSERFGYLAGTQTADGRIQLLSSGNHYEFDFDWLTTAPPPVCSGPLMVGDTATSLSDRRLSGAFRGETKQGGNRHGTWQDACLSHMIGAPADWAGEAEFAGHVRETTADLLERAFLTAPEAQEILDALAGPGGEEQAQLIVRAETAGDGADLWGAGPFGVDIACKAPDGSTVDLGDNAHRVLSAENGYKGALDGLPAGGSCEVTSADSAGATSTAITPKGGTVEISEGVAEVVLTHTFDLTSLQVTKVVDGDPGAAKPAFAFDLQCTHPGGGEAGQIVIPGESSRTLHAPDNLKATYEQLPVGAACTLVETDTGGASRTTFEVSGHADGEGGGDKATSGDRAKLTLSASPATAVVTNTFGSGGPAAPGEGSDSIAATGTSGLLVGAAALALVIAGAWLLRMRRDRATVRADS